MIWPMTFRRIVMLMKNTLASHMMDKHVYVFVDRYPERMRIMYRWMIKRKYHLY